MSHTSGGYLLAAGKNIGPHGVLLSTIAAAHLLKPQRTRTYKEARRIQIVECLRGVAALGVCWFHFTNGNPSFLSNGILKSSGRYGWIGVEIFFVISGFVVPYSLLSSNYYLNPGNYGRFLWKRVSRLDPPYLVSIALIIVLAYLSAALPSYRGDPPNISYVNVLLHVGYLSAFFQRPWLNVVYWSLAIEFQYYLLIGILFPLLISNRLLIRLLVLSGMGLSAFLIQEKGLIFPFFFLFIMGFCAFQYRTRIIARSELLCLLGLAFAGAFIILGGVIAGSGIATSGIILSFDGTNRVLNFLGRLSYSLYLVHVPIGGRIINIGERLKGGLWVKLTFLTLATGLSLACAYALFRWIETPCRRYATSFAFRDTERPG